MQTRVVPGRWPSLSFTHDAGGGVIQPPAGGGGNPNPDTLYFLSNEATSGTAILTDDFRRGNWYVVDADQPPDYHTTIPGWGGTIFANPITPAGAIRNLASIGKKPVFATSNYVGTTGVLSGGNQRNNAWHNLSGGGSGGYSEIYYRYYTFYVPANYYGPGDPAANYLWGAQKSNTVNRWNDDGGIFWAGLGYNIGHGGGESTGQFQATNNKGSNIILNQNQGNDILLVVNHWYFIEWRIRLNTVGSTNGILQVWINDGGSTGNFAAQSPILRTSYSNVDWNRTSGDTQLMGNVWLENWSSPTSTGEQFWANIYSQTTGPIGFVTP